MITKKATYRRMTEFGNVVDNYFLESADFITDKVGKCFTLAKIKEDQTYDAGLKVVIFAPKQK